MSVVIDNWGTFDVANYGDLLFPLVLEQQLHTRRPDIQVMLSSPQGGRFRPDPSRPVHRIMASDQRDFLSQIQHCDAFVLGGGDIVRLDDASLRGIYDTTSGSGPVRSYSLFLRDLGNLAEFRPVLWNAVGVPFDFTPDERSYVREATKRVRYLNVRDPASKRRLHNAGIDREVTVVPDTALLLPELYPLETLLDPIPALTESPRQGPVLIFQVWPLNTSEEEGVAAGLHFVLEQVPSARIILLPIGICHGDIQGLRSLHRRLDHQRVHRIDEELPPHDVAAIIANADAFAGTSLHGNLTAFAYGVPNLFLTRDAARLSKVEEYVTMLSGPGSLQCPLPFIGEAIRTLLTSTPRRPQQRYATMVKQLHHHFDRLAEEIPAGTDGNEDGNQRGTETRLMTELAATRDALRDQDEYLRALTLRTSQLEDEREALRSQLLQAHAQLIERDEQMLRFRTSTHPTEINELERRIEQLRDQIVTLETERTINTAELTELRTVLDGIHHGWPGRYYRFLRAVFTLGRR